MAVSDFFPSRAQHAVPQETILRRRIWCIGQVPKNSLYLGISRALQQNQSSTASSSHPLFAPSAPVRATRTSTTFLASRCSCRRTRIVALVFFVVCSSLATACAASSGVSQRHLDWLLAGRTTVVFTILRPLFIVHSSDLLLALILPALLL